MNLCSCGCDKEVTKEGNKYILGHYAKLNPPMKKPEVSKKSGNSRRGRTKETHEYLKIISEKSSDYMKNGGSVYVQSYITEESRRSQSGKITGRTKENNKGRRSQADKQSKKMKEKWKDPEFQQKQHEARHENPNKCELKILKALNSLYSNEWKFTGDKSFWIDGKNPDFTNFNSQKKLIEHFGTYWHKDDDPQELIDHYKKWGWETLVIWENELKNIDQVKIKIRDFNGCKLKI